MAKKLTPMFPPHMKPVRTGVYMATTHLSETYYRHWNGAEWLTGGHSVKAAAREARNNCPTAVQSIYWRGLAEQPK